jgi:hypothetical protein
VHYVTAREMYNVARAAMDGLSGSPAAFFDYEVQPPPRAHVRAPSAIPLRVAAGPLRVARR